MIFEKSLLIGDCGFGHIDEPKRPTELGYMLSKEYWNHGYMSEALEGILRYGFQMLYLHRVQAWTHPENKASSQFIMYKQNPRYVFVTGVSLKIGGHVYGCKAAKLL